MNSPDEVADVKAPIAMLTLLGAAILSPVTGAQSPAPNVRAEMLVSTAWLQEHLRDAGVVVVCVGRSRSDYDSGHIPGARFLPLAEIVEQHKDSLYNVPPVASLQAVFERLGIGDEARVVLYGEGGGLMAARAYFTLDYLGHGDRAALLDGGIEKWVSEAKPVERGPARYAAAHFTPQVQSDLLITTQRAHAIVETQASSYLLLDARPPQEFDGKLMSEGVPRAGHLAGAKSLYWKTLLQSDDVPSLLDPAQLKQRLESAGANPDALLVTYCRTGMQSSFTYFVAKYLGYRVAMYGGSVYEWVNRGGYDLVDSDSAAGKANAK